MADAMQEIPQAASDRLVYLVEQFESARERRDALKNELEIAQTSYEVYGEAVDSVKYVINLTCGSSL
jgi:chemotaxis regulatin CheY-phosphate phosphatase CheZ